MYSADLASKLGWMKLEGFSHDEIYAEIIDFSINGLVGLLCTDEIPEYYLGGFVHAVLEFIRRFKNYDKLKSLLEIKDVNSICTQLYNNAITEMKQEEIYEDKMSEDDFVIGFYLGVDYFFMGLQEELSA